MVQWTSISMAVVELIHDGDTVAIRNHSGWTVKLGDGVPDIFSLSTHELTTSRDQKRRTAETHGMASGVEA
jgi:hypothetical protein